MLRNILTYSGLQKFERKKKIALRDTKCIQHMLSPLRCLPGDHVMDQYPYYTSLSLTNTYMQRIDTFFRTQAKYPHVYIWSKKKKEEKKKQIRIAHTEYT